MLAFNLDIWVKVLYLFFAWSLSGKNDNCSNISIHLHDVFVYVYM